MELVTTSELPSRHARPEEAGRCCERRERTTAQLPIDLLRCDLSDDGALCSAWDMREFMASGMFVTFGELMP